MTEVIPRENRWKALAIGSLIGFAGVGLVDFLHAIFSLSGNDYTGLGFILVIGFYYILIGLPLAFILCFTIGIPIYLIINKVTDINLRAAIIMGALMGLILGSANFALFLQAWPLWIASLDWVSTICVGAFAGYISFNRTKRDTINLSEFD